MAFDRKFLFVRKQKDAPPWSRRKELSVDLLDLFLALVIESCLELFSRKRAGNRGHRGESAEGLRQSHRKVEGASLPGSDCLLAKTNLGFYIFSHSLSSWTLSFCCHLSGE